MPSTIINLSEAERQLLTLFQNSRDPYDEQSVTLGYVNGTEVCLMGWPQRPSHRDPREVPPHKNQVDSMQIVLEGEMTLYYPDEDEVVTLKPGDCHVVPAGKMHSCVSSKKTRVLVIVGSQGQRGSPPQE